MNSEKRFPRTWETVKQGIAEGVAPGFVFGYWEQRDPHRFFLEAQGNRRLLPSSLPMGVDTVFDLASVTKVFSTATLAAVLVERGWLNWNTSVASILHGYPFQEVRIKHLLSHTAGYMAWSPFWEKLRHRFAPTPLEQVPVTLRQKLMRELVLSIAPEVAPGQKAVYSDLSFLVLGFLLENLTQMPLDQAVKRFVWNPMGIQGAYYRRINQSVLRSTDEKVAATENCPWRGGVLQGQVHDDNCWAMGGYGGHAGAFGTGKNVLQFAKKMMQGFLSPHVMRAVWSRVAEPFGCERTLGWDTPSASGSSVGRLFSTYSVGHLGFTGTSLWIDLDAKLAVVLLSNRVHPSRENTKIKEFRPRFHEAFRQDLGR